MVLLAFRDSLGLQSLPGLKMKLCVMVTGMETAMPLRRFRPGVAP